MEKKYKYLLHKDKKFLIKKFNIYNLLINILIVATFLIDFFVIIINILHIVPSITMFGILVGDILLILMIIFRIKTKIYFEALIEIIFKEQDTKITDLNDELKNLKGQSND